LFKEWRRRRAGFTCPAVIRRLIFFMVAVLAAGAVPSGPAGDPVAEFWRQPGLDGPTNHPGIEGISWLEDRLDQFRGGLVLVTHDRHLLDRLTTGSGPAGREGRVLELDRGGAYLHAGGYQGYLDGRAEQQLGRVRPGRLKGFSALACGTGRRLPPQ